MQRFVKATIACLVIVGFALAAEHQGLITSVSKDEVKITVGKKKGEKGEEKVFKAKGLKITKGKDKTDVSIDDVTKMIEESKGKVKGVFGKVTTEGEGDKEVAVSIAVGGGKKK
jgi:hypothetical protein